MTRLFIKWLNPAILTVLVFFLSVPTGKAQPVDCGIRISLLTCSPGEDLYATFGHSAIRVIDSSRNLDVVFNYGTFNFDEQNFYLKFTRGKLQFSISADYFNSFVYSYQLENRSITEQLLNLTCEEKQSLVAYLDWNMLPANRYYKYDFTFDNCTTRLRDLLDTATNNQLVYDTILSKPITFRNAIHDYLNRNNKSWSKLGIDILLGSRLDRKMTNKESSFLPDNLMQAFDSAKLRDAPLVGEKEVILKNKFVPLISDNVTNPLFLFSCLFVLIAFLSFSHNKRIEKVLKSLDGVLFFINGLLGILLIFMWVGTDHFMTKDNYNLLWAWPTNVVAAFYVHSRNSKARIYFLVFALAQLLLLGLWVFLPQELNMALIPINGILVFRSLLTYIAKKRLHAGIKIQK